MQASGDPRPAGRRLRCARLDVLGAQATVFGDTSKHAWPDLLAVVEGEHQVGPAGTGEDAVRAGLALDNPAHAQQRRQDPPGVCTGPVAHAALKEISRNCLLYTSDAADEED